MCTISGVYSHSYRRKNKNPAELYKNFALLKLLVFPFLLWKYSNKDDMIQTTCNFIVISREKTNKTIFFFLLKMYPDIVQEK